MIEESPAAKEAEVLVMEKIQEMENSGPKLR